MNWNGSKSLAPTSTANRPGRANFELAVSALVRQSPMLLQHAWGSHLGARTFLRKSTAWVIAARVGAALASAFNNTKSCMVTLYRVVTARLAALYGLRVLR